MNRKWKNVCLAALRENFGVSDYRPGQKAAASCLLSGRDLLCILPTGAGKSLCWQLPAVVHPGLTVVISPLIALMHDQVEGLKRRGIRAAAINSLMSPQERQYAEEMIRSGHVRILFVAPERIGTPAFQALCRDCPPWLVVVDEAHCVVQWGEAFRPAYGRIGAFVQSLKKRPVLCAMTATADADMQRQIADQLGMRFHKRVMLPVLRENLHYSVRTTLHPTREILRLLDADEGRTVVFCRTRERTEQLSALLQKRGHAADHYHAGLTREERTAAQERFRHGETRILASTTAFGMGIDIPDIRRVIHDRLPGSVIDLVQQSGRAGRDGKRAECIILLSPAELLHSREILAAMRSQNKHRPFECLRLMRRCWQPMRQLLRVVMVQNCIPAGIAAFFGQRARPCGCCSACLHGPLAKQTPNLPCMDEPALRWWLLLWQRDALADQLGIPPEEIVTRAQLQRSARTLDMPDTPYAGAFRHLMAALKGKGRYTHPD